MSLKIIIIGTSILIVTFCGMSLLRRVIRKCSPIKADTAEINLVPDQQNSETQTPNESESDSTVDESEYDDGTESEERNKLNEEYRKKRRKLNAMLRKSGRKQSKLEQTQKAILQKEAEIQELTRILRTNDIIYKALREENKAKRMEMKSLCSQSPVEVDKYAKKREPFFYRKYNNIKTAADAKNLMDTIGQRQKALSNLELMTYKRYLNLTHDLKLRVLEVRPSVSPIPIFTSMLQEFRINTMNGETSTVSATQPTYETHGVITIEERDPPQLEMPPDLRPFDNTGFDVTVD